MFNHKNYYISWKFSGQILPVQFKKRGIFIDGMCDCIIKDNQTKENLAVGRSYKAVEDRHNKALGRKHSMRRALEMLTADMPEEEARTLRTEMWSAYFKNCSE
jgi:hypothetical protein